MKKKVIIFRFGSSLPTKKEYTMVGQITDGSHEAVWCGNQFGVISIVKTSMTPTEITELFNQLAEEFEDSLPVIVFEPGKDVGFNFDKEFFTEFETCNQTFDEAFGESLNKCVLSLDELLTLVQSKGLSQFTTEELARLHELSK